MRVMRTALLLAMGAVFSGLLLLVPALHAATRLGTPPAGATWALILLPLALLPFVPGARAPWVGLFAWPCAHLPALVAVPSLTDAVVYGGPAGLWGLTAVAAAGTAWYVVLLWPARPLPRRGEEAPSARRAPPTHPPKPPPTQPPTQPTTHPVVLLAAAMALGCFAALAQGVLRSPLPPPTTANVGLLFGVLLAWLAAGHLIAGRLADVVLSPRQRQRFLHELLTVRRGSRRAALLATAAALITLTLALIWYLTEGS